MSITRREFLKGTAAGAAGLAVAGLFGAGKEKTVIAAEETTEAAAAAEAAQQPANVQAFLSANLNPQDYDYTQNDVEDFAKTKIFEPWQFGPLTIENRIVKSAAGSAYLPTAKKEEIIAEYTNWAKGGAGLIWIEDFANLYTNYPASYKVYSREDCYVSDIAAAIHAEGKFCGYQLSLMGASFSGFDASTAEEYASAHADDMTLEELKKLQEDFIDAAKFLKEQGVDAIEINAAGNNIGQAFLSRNRNARTDEYGPQSIENRVRFLREIIEGIKEVNGKDFPVQILINVIEENDKDLGQRASFTTAEENQMIAKELENAGADALHLRLGPYAMHVAEFASDLYFTGYGINGTTAMGTQFDFSKHFQGKLIANHSGCGLNMNIAGEVKSAVSIPVGTVTYMDPAHAPNYFVEAIDAEKFDFMLMTRPMIADPEYVNKLKENRIDEIRPCNRCLSCHFDTDKEGNFYEHCRVNACHMRAYHDEMPEGYDVVPAETAKKVMVIGGGPAGMEAAHIAAQRGHTVTLYEKNGYLGGLLPFANTIKGPHENLSEYMTYLKKELEVYNVTVETGTEVTAEMINEAAPDAVILAVGGVRDTLGLEATAGTSIVSIADIMTAELGDNVVIYGGGAQAVDVTMYLQAQGKNVTIIMPDAEAALDKEQSSWVRTFVKPMIYARGTNVWPNAQIVSVGDGEVTFLGDAGVNLTIKCDTLVEAMDMLPNTSLLDGVDSAIATYAVGDCKEPWNIAEAVATANIAARNI
ncbi:MAG: FAD-dependent oxidoreductase [Eubacteriales bacterium]|nr:FAD-dependent oxidoreductase [Eubacteriales bacterium]